MLTKKRLFITTIAVFALSLAALGAPKKAVERPMKITGHITVTINLESGVYVMLDWGEATHSGRFVNQGAGNWDLVNNHPAQGGGIFTAANGDKVFWVENDPGVVEATSGTGRFENITGGFTYVPNNLEVTFSQDGKTMVITFNYKGEGALIY
jgi:hypothetical protein